MKRKIRIVYPDGMGGCIDGEYICAHSNPGHPEKPAKCKTYDDAEILRQLISHSTFEGRYQYKDEEFDSWIIEPGTYEICGHTLTLFNMRILVGDRRYAMCSAKKQLDEYIGII